MAEANAPVMRGGSFYGAVQRRHEQCDAIFTDLQHSSARKLPEHAHELPFFAVLLEGDYRSAMAASTSSLAHSRLPTVPLECPIRMKSGHGVFAFSKSKFGRVGEGEYKTAPETWMQPTMNMVAEKCYGWR